MGRGGHLSEVVLDKTVGYPPCPGDGGASDGGASDGGAGDGGAGDGGSAPGLDPYGPHDCTPVDSIGDASHFDGSLYFSGTAPDEEFACTFTLEGYAIKKIYKTEVQGMPNDYGSYSVRPAVVGLVVPWQEAGFYIDDSTVTPEGTYWTTFTATNEPEWDPAEDFGVSLVPPDSDLTDPNGTYIVRFTNAGIRGGGGGGGIELTEADLVDIKVVLWGADGPEGAPPPRPENPVDEEEDYFACSASSTGSTDFELVRIPGIDGLVPLAVDGDVGFAESQLTAVSVSDWNGADQLVLDNGSSTVTLTPSSSSATLSGSGWWFGGVDFAAAKTGGSGTWTAPDISLSHSCPATRSNGNTDVDQGYALSLSTLASVVDDATGTPGLGALLLSAPEDDWPVYLVRVAPVLSGGSTTHALILTIQGTDEEVALPLEQIEFGKWSLDASGYGWQAAGVVSRHVGYLRLALSSGSVELPSGTVTLSATTVDLPVHPTPN